MGVQKVLKTDSLKTLPNAILLLLRLARFLMNQSFGLEVIFNRKTTGATYLGPVIYTY